MSYIQHLKPSGNIIIIIDERENSSVLYLFHVFVLAEHHEKFLPIFRYVTKKIELSRG